MHSSHSSTSHPRPRVSGAPRVPLVACVVLGALSACQDGPAAPDRAQVAPATAAAITPLDSNSNVTALGAAPEDILFARKDEQGVWQLFTVMPDRTNRKPLTTETVHHMDPARSPDFKSIAYVEQAAGGGGTRLVVMNANGANPKVVTPYMHVITHPSFSPDGKTLAFAAKVGATGGAISQIFTVPVQGGSTPTRLTNDFNNDVRPTWKSANQIVFVGGSATDRQVWSISPGGSRATPVTSVGSGDVSDVAVSNDATKMALVFNQARMIQVFDFSTSRPTSSVIYQSVLGETVSQPSFSADGSQLVFIDTDAGGSDLARISSTGGAVYHLTGDATPDANPAWGR